VLVIAQLFNSLNSRSERESAFRGFFGNLRLFGAIALSAGLQIVGSITRARNDARLDECART
jgi:magnesium-transporting ATPase (P-type)